MSDSLMLAAATERRHAKDFFGNRRVPSLRFHKASGQMFVVLSGRAIYCGKPDEPVTEQRYHQAIAEWMAAGRQAAADPDALTVKELVARFWVHAEQYYRTETDFRNKELEQFKLAFRPLKELYAESPATDFGPRALKALQQKMVQMGWCRPYINKQVNRIRHAFRWAVSDELLPGSVLEALRSVPGLKLGRTDAREPKAVKPAPMKMVLAIKPFVSRQVWAMVQLQLLTAARPGEIIRMQPCDIDRGTETVNEDFLLADDEQAAGDTEILRATFTQAAEGGQRIWVYRPAHHKTAHRGFSKKVWIGPRAQQVLGPFLLREPEAYCFSPAESMEEWRKQAFENRKTPDGQGNTRGTNCKERPKWTPGQRYTTSTYRLAIARGCDLAFPPPEPLAQREDETKDQWQARLTKEQKAELKAWRKAHRWHPHQLRHNAATYLRREFGLEAARIILGHQSTAVTEIYAEKDEQQAVEAIMKVG
jgi:integrase